MPVELTGRIVPPGDTDYLEDSAGWELLFTHYPLVVVSLSRRRTCSTR